VRHPDPEPPAPAEHCTSPPPVQEARIGETQPRGSRFARMMLSSVKRVVHAIRGPSPSRSQATVPPRFYHQHNLTDADRPHEQSNLLRATATTRRIPVTASNKPSSSLYRQQGIRPHVDADSKRFPFDNFKHCFNPLFKVLFIFRSRYLFAIGLAAIFSFTRSLPRTLG